MNRTCLEPFYQAIQTEQYVLVGAFKKPIGNQGAIVAHFSPLLQEEALATLPALFVERMQVKVPYRVKELALTNAKTVVALAGVQTKTEAYQLSSLPIFLPTSLSTTFFPPRPYGALIGFLVEDVQLGTLGNIQEIQSIRDQYLFEVAFQGKVLLIPCGAPFVLQTDVKRKTVVVALPEGYLEAMLA
ncbi:MAG TPA: hypothetical protein VK133_01050 [Amoebophilaceae bacterium]|jgi:16S rRNA processing protein RimM|nr:hypothetical protein [Amoebophilaceae bacterium]